MQRCLVEIKIFLSYLLWFWTELLKNIWCEFYRRWQERKLFRKKLLIKVTVLRSKSRCWEPFFFELIKYIKQLTNSFQIHFSSSIDKKTITNKLLLFKKNYKSAVIQKRNLENVSFISPLPHSTTIFYTAKKD